MFSGLREHEMRSNPCIIGGKIPFDPNIIYFRVCLKSCFQTHLRKGFLEMDDTDSVPSENANYTPTIPYE